MESIFNYTNYHIFLKDYYDVSKVEKPHFSYQYFADHTGFKSKSYLYKVIKGDKALTVDGSRKIGKYIKLTSKEQLYFEAIIGFTNSKTVEERENYFSQLQKLSHGSRSSRIRQNQFDYFNHWYNAVIRELVEISDWNGDYSKLATMVVPNISKKEAIQSVELLLSCNFITIDSNGKYRRANRAITTGEDVVSLAVNHFQKENLELAKEAISRFPRGIRDISTLTVSISENGANRIQEEIAAFRQKIIGIVNSEPIVDRVYQINFQAFPLTVLPKGDI